MKTARGLQVGAKGCLAKLVAGQDARFIPCRPGVQNST